MFKKIINASIKLVQNYLPEPFIFASLLTLVAFVIAMPVCRQSPIEVLENWGSGVWSLLAFSMQMALILVCGSALADSPSVKKGLNSLARIAKTPITAIALVSFVSAVACWRNWGFGLIVGVVFAKSIARNLKGVDYRLLIASAYSGFVVWHGGISGSVPLTIATEGEALSKATAGVITHAVPISQTIFSLYNLLISIAIIVALVVVNSLMHPKKEEVVSIDPKLLEEKEPERKLIEPTLSYFSYGLDLLCLFDDFQRSIVRFECGNSPFLVSRLAAAQNTSQIRGGIHQGSSRKCRNNVAVSLLCRYNGHYDGSRRERIVACRSDKRFLYLGIEPTYLSDTYIPQCRLGKCLCAFGRRAVGGASSDNDAGRSSLGSSTLAYGNVNCLGRRLDQPYTTILGNSGTRNRQIGSKRHHGILSYQPDNNGNNHLIGIVSLVVRIKRRSIEIKRRFV